MTEAQTRQTNPGADGAESGFPRRAARWFVDRIELSRGMAGHNFRSMEGLRGCAVFLVFLVHFATLVGPWLDPHGGQVEVFDALHTIGNRGVDLFFVLSGYLIYGSLMNRPQRFGAFMLRRIERIYPAFVFVLLVYIGLSFARPGERIALGDGVSGALYLLSNLLLLPGVFPIEPIVTVAWSLSYEMLYYCAVPLLLVTFSLRELSARSRVLVFATIGAAIVGYCLFRAGPVRLVMFIFGIVLWEARRDGRRLRLEDWKVAGLVGIAFMATLVPTFGSTGYTLKTVLLGCAFFALTQSCLSTEPGRISRFFDLTPLRWLGNMSYSYYLLHGLVLKVAFAILGQRIAAGYWSAAAVWTLLPALFIVTLIPTAALFLFVEYPLSLSANRFFADRSARAIRPRMNTSTPDRGTHP
jgi:peptidoglycan/LPS O-acetylase OafA/YrhL